VADEAGAFAARIEEAWRTAGFDAPGNFDLAKALGTKQQVVAGLVQHLLKSGALVRLSPDVVVHADLLAGIEAKVAEQKGRTMSVGDFRDLLGLTRKYLIPLLEHLDRKKVTRRVGDARVVV
jgi:selenocysteine-specific elongation factor